MLFHLTSTLAHAVHTIQPGGRRWEDDQMAAGGKAEALRKIWNSVRVVIEEISMIAAMMYNMLDFRSMLDRSQDFSVSAHT